MHERAMFQVMRVRLESGSPWAHDSFLHKNNKNRLDRHVPAGGSPRRSAVGSWAAASLPRQLPRALWHPWPLPSRNQHPAPFRAAATQNGATRPRLVHRWWGHPPSHHPAPASISEPDWGAEHCSHQEPHL